jgi:hypothetical protein
MKSTAGRLTIVASLGVLGACAGVLFTAPPGSTISLLASPPFVAADGGVSVITAFVIEPAGTTVADGTVVLFFTDIGLIDRQGKTRDGIARVNFTSDSRSGIAHITAISGGAAPAVAPNPSPSASPVSTPGATGDGVGTTTVAVGNVRVKAVCCLRADPPRITGSNSTHVFARVIDENGNGIPNVPVFFEIATTPDPGTEFFDVTGPVFTNQSGEAEDVLRTRRDLAGNASVRARAVGAGVTVVSDPLIIPIR